MCLSNFRANQTHGERVGKKMRLYWTSRETDWDKDIWYERSPGCCGRMWFPYAEKFMTCFPRIAVRVFWICIKIKELWLKLKGLERMNRRKYDADETNWYLVAACLGLVLATILFFLILKG